jgi:plasmid stabilization system protein ParE
VSRVHYTHAAEQDLDDIAEYTIAQWGEEQCAKYFDLLEQTCERIIPANIRHARPVPRRPELLRWRCERHVVYFRQLRGSVEIVRILHAQMLPTNHL